MTQKTALVTGGSGFLGRYVRDELFRRGAHVLSPTRRECNLLDHTMTGRFFQMTKPDVVVHLAATVGGIGANRAEPGRFFFENTLMGLNVVEAARVTDVTKVILVGTVCAYPKFTPAPFKEDDLWSGYPEETNAPYGIAKKALLVMGQAYRQQYGMNVIYLLPVNLYGPYDHDDLEKSHVIPAMIRKFMEAKRAGAPEVVLWGTGTPTREFLYVEDAAGGVADATEKYDGPDPVNLGSGCEISIRNLAITIASIVGYKGDIVYDPTKPDGQPRRLLDTSRALERFGWKAKTSLFDGLRTTVAWMREKYEGASA